MKKHFDDFDLAKRYSIQAAEELSTLIDQRSGLMLDFTSDKFSNYLLSIANSLVFFPNHWKKVMYKALAQDDWFCNK